MSGALYDPRGGVLRKTEQAPERVEVLHALPSANRGRKALVPRSRAGSRAADADDIARVGARNEQVLHKKLIRFLCSDPSLIRRRNSAHTSSWRGGTDQRTVPYGSEIPSLVPASRVCRTAPALKVSPKPFERRSRLFSIARAAPFPGTAATRPCGSRPRCGRRETPRRRAGCRGAPAPGAVGARRSAA